MKIEKKIEQFDFKKLLNKMMKIAIGIHQLINSSTTIMIPKQQTNPKSKGTVMSSKNPKYLSKPKL